MCYSTSLRKERDNIQQRLLTRGLSASFNRPKEYTPYYHLNGFTHGNLYIIKMNEPKSIYPASWGLVPNWEAHNPKEFWNKSNTLNARVETIFEKASFKESANEKRCLILADGFYEPHHVNSVSIPYFCYQPSKEYPKGDLFLFAGLYNELDADSFSATILTTDANDFFAKIHNKKKRMPLVLDSNFYLDWLDDGLNQQQLNEIMAVGFTGEEFNAHPVSRDLYKKRIDTNTPYFVRPVEKDTLF